MRKTIITACILMFVAQDANAMGLGSMRPNILRAAVAGTIEHTSEVARPSWVISIAETMAGLAKALRESVMTPAVQAESPETLTI